MDNVETKNLDLRGLSDRGFIGFSIKTIDTPENSRVHNDFFSFCKEECHNDYTLGLSILLNVYDSNKMFSMFWEEFNELKARVSELEAKEVKPSSIEKDEKGDLF